MSEPEKLPNKVELSKDRLDVLSKEDLLACFVKQTAYAEELEKQIKRKEDEASARNLQQEATLREKFLVMRLTTKESESHDYLNQLDELRCSVAGGYRHTHLDPAVNVVFERMKKELVTNKEKYEQCQQELNAWKFTSDSTMGKKLMAKCRMLLTENDELGKMVSSGQIASLEGDVSLAKMTCDELRTAQTEAESMLWSLDEEMEGLQSVVVCLQQKLNAADMNGESAGTGALTSDAESAVTAPPLEPDFSDSPSANLAPGSAFSSSNGNSRSAGTPPAPSSDSRQSAVGQVPNLAEPSFDPIPHAPPVGMETDNWHHRGYATVAGGQCSRTSTPEMARTASPQLIGIPMKTKQALQQSGIVAISPPLVGPNISAGGSSDGNAKLDFDCGIRPASFSNQVVADPPGSNRSYKKRRTPTPPAPGGSTLSSSSPVNGAPIVPPFSNAASADNAPFFSAIGDPSHSWNKGQRTLDEEHPAAPVISSGDHRTLEESLAVPSFQKFADIAGSSGRQREETADPSPSAAQPPDRKRRRKAAASPELVDPFHSNHASSTVLNAGSAASRHVHLATYGKGHAQSRHVNGGTDASPILEEGRNAAASPGHSGANMVNGAVATTPPCPGPYPDQFLDEETD